ncbi:MAG TPA: serine hydrolase domain-containing protein [Methanoregulaceae archaeon]|nr:serine hydrolase domain-containing protein [Methanoregulaceae archaeon]
MKSRSRRDHFLFLAASLAICLILTPSCAAIQDSAKLYDFDAFVTRTMAEYDVPGAVIGIVENDTVVYLKGFGVREYGKPAPVDPDTRFQVASVTKYITAGAIGTLVDEGKLDWDTPVVTYLPGFVLKDTYAGQHATLRDLLAHRSGLKAYDGGLLGRVGYSNLEMLEQMRYLEPGSSFRECSQYSNAGFFIAGEVAAAVDNRSWEDLTDARILRPLNMTRSGTQFETLYFDENHIAGHIGSDGGVSIMPLEVDAFPAAGQVVSTGRDMTQWMRMILAGGLVDGRQILKPETIKQIHAASMPLGSNGPLSDPNGANGMGCDSYNFLGERVIEKNGALNGVRSIVTLIPGKKSGIVVIANKNLVVFPEAVRTEFLERYIGKSEVDLQAKVKAQQAMWDMLGQTSPTPSNPGPAKLDPSMIAGVYQSDLYGELQVNPGPDAGNMTIQMGLNRFPGTITHWTDDTWYLSWPNPDDMAGFVTFTPGLSGSVTGITSDEFGPFVRTIPGLPDLSKLPFF